MNQRWNSHDYRDNARYVPELGADILGWLAPQAHEYILDLGCGDGHLSLKIAETGARVLGLDDSPDLLEVAAQQGLETAQGDGQSLNYNNLFDAVFSNAALHWMTRADDVLAGVFRALKPEGRFVAEFGGFGNIAAITTALQAMAQTHGIEKTKVIPWFFPHEDDYRQRLEAAGFIVDKIERIPRLTPLPTGIRGWLETFATELWRGQSVDMKNRYLDQLEVLLKPALCDHKGNWYADYVRLRVIARKSVSKIQDF